MKKSLIAIVAAASISGCATQTFEISGGNNSTTPNKETMQPFFISGLGQTQEMNAAEICGGAEKVAKVESHMSFLNGFLGMVSWGIYTPRQAKVYCTK
ncbi:Bor family protein [Marinagarivorans algicola]|uniref:Bor family protein n=1 Tax=Marinagarivorans algicola TaxID=1513270 RepID=UPI0006B583CD|nr:Bor family protein [Marinagarivorans algicola]